MARRSLSSKDIKNGMAYIHDRLVGQHMSARDVMNDPNLPFSLTTYYKYLPKFEKSLKSIDDDLTPTKAIAKNSKLDELKAKNEELQNELDVLLKFLGRKFVAAEIGEKNENNRSDAEMH